MSYPILSNLTNPHDVKSFTPEQRHDLCEELRKMVLDVVSGTGGHLSSNLGIVELTVALHACFDLSSDSVVYDVGHQIYPHKLMTGRFENFHTLKKKGGVSGYPSPEESVYDPFFTSHSSTSLSSALGLCAAADHQNSDKRSIAVIGDGALSAGIAFEALNNAGALNKNLLVILNDNEMSISPSVGALSKSLAKLRANPTYNDIRNEMDRFLKHVPMVGSTLRHIKERFINSTHLALLPGFIFKALGFRYFGPIDGNDVELLIQEVENLKKLQGPILLHILTKKGKGYDPATKDPVAYHGVTPFQPYSIPTEDEKEKKEQPSYTAVFTKALIEAGKKDKKVVAITAAMAEGTGLADFEKVFPDRYYDVGIAEQHAVCFGAALAKGGMKPVVAIYSTFLQRAYDQLFQDVSLQKLAPLFCLDRAGLVGSDGPTQHGLNDIAYTRHLPHFVIMAPSSGPELTAMVDFGLAIDKPAVIRYAKDKAPMTHHDSDMAPIELGKSELLRKGHDYCLVGYGAVIKEVLKAAEILEKQDIYCSVVNARFAKPLDWEGIAKYAQGSKACFTIEDHMLAGGFGSAVLEAFSDNQVMMPVVRLGINDQLIDHASRSEQFAEVGIDAAGIVKAVQSKAQCETPASPVVQSK